jgi:hypothetical protein
MISGLAKLNVQFIYFKIKGFEFTIFLKKSNTNFFEKINIFLVNFIF